MNKKICLILSVAVVTLLVGCIPKGWVTSTPKLPNPNIEQSDKINGLVLPNTPGRAKNENRLITQLITDAKGDPTGWTIISSRASRDAGTRAPIHVHPYGGQTCVLSGEMSLYLDGELINKKAGPNECYWMPAGRRMSAINTGGTTSTFVDTFVVPEGEQVWLVVEPGLQHLQDQFDTMFRSAPPNKQHKH
jgi:hypothetical protein